ncbi:YkgJ family cysteine cluster protein [Lichenihabitans sp. PAMC28606]|uniref:YkgJ family cysteine cluster protein n=1 Tax=Lichenihabitans sp. PAMC28606 TaxID=2880932 RepID=UPI001D0BD809|nr:YkgJ family cysteine cluster protein [Lichenihabitans sp. PAMC28606]UDL94681.1 YkgJ family cysteine cluster protein [Lichenihabitans sp. PAMC28606]
MPICSARAMTERPIDAASLLVQGRECGTCTMCCKVFRIPEVDKVAGQWCKFVVQGRGCGIHATRPDVCRTFYCHYLRNPTLGPEWKPERAKFVLYTEMGGKRLVVAADPAAPSAWRNAPYYALFKRMALAGVARNHQILVFNGLRATAVLPDRDVDLGSVEVGDEVIYHAARGTIDVELRRKVG